MKKIAALLMTAVLLVSLFAGCSGGDKGQGGTNGGDDKQTEQGGGTGDSSQDGSGSDTSGEGAQGGEDTFKTVRIGVGYDPTTFDYHELNLDSATIAVGLVGEGLLRNRQGEIGGGAADTWEVSDDAKVWKFHIRDGLTYSDGTTPITAEDFYYAAQRELDPEAGHGNVTFDLLNSEDYYNGECGFDEVGVKLIDESTIEYTFTNPAYETAFTGSAFFFPMEQSFVEEAGTSYASSVETFMGNGPFVLSEWVLDSSFKLVKNENYWDKDSIHMDEINFVIGATGDTAVDMMLAGELDFAPVGTLNQQNALADAGFANFSFTNSYRCLNLNHKGMSGEMAEFLGNANFRKALSLAIDRQALCASVLTTDTPATRLTAPSEMGGELVEKYPYEAWSATAQPEEAKKYLDLALSELGKTADDIPVIDLLCYEAQGSIDVLSAVQDMLRTNLGIESQINPQTIQVMVSNAMNGDYDLWLGGNSLEQPDALGGFLAGYWTPNYSPLRGYSNEAYDALYEKAVAAPTLEEREAAYFEVEKYFCEETLLILLSWTQGFYSYVDGYEGFYCDVDIDFTYLDYTK